MASQYQVMKRGAETWEIIRVETLWRNAHEYEMFARVTRVDALYYIEFAEWKEAGFEWRREPRGYLLPRAAFKIAIKGPAKKEVH